MCVWIYVGNIRFVVGMFFWSDAVSLQFLMDSWTPGITKAMQKHCRVTQNQGFAYLWKVCFQTPFGLHFGIILETLWHPNVFCICWGVRLLDRKCKKLGPNRDAEAGQKEVPDRTISKDLYFILLEESRQLGRRLNARGYGLNSRRLMAHRAAGFVKGISSHK